MVHLEQQHLPALRANPGLVQDPVCQHTAVSLPGLPGFQPGVHRCQRDPGSEVVTLGTRRLLHLLPENLCVVSFCRSGGHVDELLISMSLYRSVSDLMLYRRVLVPSSDFST